MQDFNGKVVFVAGGGSGIGLGVAGAFAEQGARVAVADIDEPSARAAADQLATAHGAQAIGLGLDVSDPAAWVSAVDAAERALGPVDVLCNSAGLLGAARPLVDIPPARLQRLFDVTVFGVIHGVQCVAPRMRGRGGHIVTISSIGALDPVPSLADYCAAKAALVAMSQCLAAELAPDGIGVSVVCPGRVNTRLAETTARLMGEPAP
ncbi:MAG: family NAD(P)-dependent oxidoreductase, partial [Phenylobacterium sp.]|nr:family NAD(P)-dependent oxidoreductase [Phenylobacterium sp.]